MADAEGGRHANPPLGGLLTNVADDDGLFSFVLDGNEAKVQLVWEVEHGSAATCADGHYELLTLGHHHQVIGVVALGLRAEAYNVGDVHAWGHFGGHLIDVGAGGTLAALERGSFLAGDHGFFGWGHRKEF